jgi:hypothetical protein
LEKEKFELTVDDFVFLDAKMQEIGFLSTEISDQKKLFYRLGLIPPREITGREKTYSYHNHGYTVIIHTTYLEKEKKWRDTGTDSGWVLIRKGDEAVYFARPFKRSKGFIIKILRYAWITKWKVNNRPLCHECRGYMDIYRKKGSRQYFWICNKSKSHNDQRATFLPWDYMLPKKASEFVSIRRTDTEKYKKKNARDGIERTPAAKIRKKWTISNPENLA